MNALLLRGDETTVLVDTGSGITSAWWPYPGYYCDTLGALAEEGVTAEEVDLIVLTHLDFDHAGGLLTGAWPKNIELVFPGTPVAMLEGAAQAAREDDPEGPLNVATYLVSLLDQTQLLIEADDGEEVVSGIRLCSAPGHRPGHAIIEIDGAEPITHLADVLHHELHARHPEWDGFGDLDPVTALATRRRLLGLMADSARNVVASHLPGPHPLRVVREADAFRFVRASGTSDAQC